MSKWLACLRLESRPLFYRRVRLVELNHRIFQPKEVNAKHAVTKGVELSKTVTTAAKQLHCADRQAKQLQAPYSGWMVQPANGATVPAITINPSTANAVIIRMIVLLRRVAARSATSSDSNSIRVILFMSFAMIAPLWPLTGWLDFSLHAQYSTIVLGCQKPVPSGCISELDRWYRCCGGPPLRRAA